MNSKQETMTADNDTDRQEKQIRITTGLDPADYLAVPLLDLLSWEACYKELYLRLHPDGFRCACGSDERNSHGSTKACFPIYMCRDCGRTYSMLTGSPFSGTKLGAKQLVVFMRLWAAGVSSPEIGRQVGLHRSSVLQLQDKLRIYARHGRGRA